MAEMERFERELGAALVGYADEVPTDVDAIELTRAIADAETRRSLWLTLPWSVRARPALRLAFVVAALLGLTIGMIALAQLITPTRGDVTLTGTMTCAGAAWTAEASPVTLECTVDLHDERAIGATDLRIDAPVGRVGFQARTGDIDLLASGGDWTGDLHLTIARSGAAAGEAVLVGRGSVDGLVLRLRITSTDGLRWGVLGSIGTDR